MADFEQTGKIRAGIQTRKLIQILSVKNSGLKPRPRSKVHTEAPVFRVDCFKILQGFGLFPCRKLGFA